MKLEVKSVSVNITEKEAAEILNGLRFGIGNKTFGSEGQQHCEAAIKLKDLLQGSFINATKGIHFN